MVPEKNQQNIHEKDKQKGISYLASVQNNIRCN
jgi:hypothetical protein